MSKSCHKCCGKAKVTLPCHSFCTKHYYESYNKYLEDLVKYLVTSPSNIHTRLRPIGCPQCNEPATYMSPLILSDIIETQETDETKKFFYKYAIHFCEFFLSGVETKFETCTSCGKLLINNDPYRLCFCDEDFKNQFEYFVGYYIYTQKRNNSNIWDELEDALKRLKGAHAKMVNYTAIYNEAETKDFKGSCSDNGSLYVVNENSLFKGDRISLIDNRYPGVVGIYADILERTKTEIKLKHPKSFIVAFKINYN